MAQASLDVRDDCSVRISKLLSALILPERSSCRLQLPEFANILDGHGSTNAKKLLSPLVQPTSPGPSLPSSPPGRISTLRASPVLGPTRTSSSSPLSQSKLRYTAYEPPSIPSTRFGREHKGGGGSRASLSSRRSSSRISELSLDKDVNGSHLADTVTPGELALVANMEEMNVGAYGRGRQEHHVSHRVSSIFWLN